MENELGFLIISRSGASPQKAMRRSLLISGSFIN
jgi:hypothetical protein